MRLPMVLLKKLASNGLRGGSCSRKQYSISRRDSSPPSLSFIMDTSDVRSSQAMLGNLMRNTATLRTRTTMFVFSTFKSVTIVGTHLKRLLSSRSAGGSVVIRVTSSCMQWSWERKSSSRRFWALHSCSTSSSSISSLSVTSSLSSSWSMWEVVCKSNFQNMVAAVTGDTALVRRTGEWGSVSPTIIQGGARRPNGLPHPPRQVNCI